MEEEIETLECMSSHTRKVKEGSAHARKVTDVIMGAGLGIVAGRT